MSSAPPAETPPAAEPPWAQEMAENYRAGTISQFVLYGAVKDVVAVPATDAAAPVGNTAPPWQFTSLEEYLAGHVFAQRDVVLFYDRGTGIRARKGAEEFQRFLAAFDAVNDTTYSKAAGALPRDPAAALRLLDRFIAGGLHRPKPLKMAIVMDYAHLILPQAEVVQLVGELGESLITVQDWAADPTILGADVTTVLLTENLHDLNDAVVRSPYSAKIQVALPTEAELRAYVGALLAGDPSLGPVCQVSVDVIASRCVGLSRVNVRNLLRFAAANNRPITMEFLTNIKKELIEKECYGLLEFVESPWQLDMVAGHDAAKAWLVDDSELLKRGELESIPMGYLLTGRIGTGKTFLVTCWAGQIGIPCVQFKNFRDKWMGSSEGNLEKIFSVLDALGQVVVFVDEADQAMGSRSGGEGDSGLSGRIYSMMAQKMSDTRLRGKIIWVLATSRPDLLEVDLKRPGRLDVHIPLFPPQDDASRHELLRVMAKKVGMEIAPEDVPPLPAGMEIGGNEMEAILVRANRRWQLQEPPGATPLPQIIGEVLAEYRPSAHVRRYEYMDLVAVKECTDDRFLPPRYRTMSPEDLEARLQALSGYM